MRLEDFFFFKLSRIIVLQRQKVSILALYLLLKSLLSDSLTLVPNGRTDRRTDGQTDGRNDERTDGRTDGRTDERTNGRTDGRTDGRTNERTNGRTVLWWMGERIDVPQRKKGRPNKHADLSFITYYNIDMSNDLSAFKTNGLLLISNTHKIK